MSVQVPTYLRIYFTASIAHFFPLWRSVWVTSLRVQTGIQQEFSRLCGWSNPGQSLSRYVLPIRTSTALHCPREQRSSAATRRSLAVLSAELGTSVLVPRWA